MTSTTQTNGIVWIGDPANPDVPVLEDANVTIAVESAIADEIAIHAIEPGRSNAVASLYVTRAQAALIAAQLLAEACKRP